MAVTLMLTEEKEKTKGYFWLILSSWLICGAGIILALVFYQRLQPEIPVFYSLAEGNAQLADKKMIFLLPAIGLVICLTHQLLLVFGKKYNLFLKRLFSLVTLIFEIMILIINLRIIWLVI